MLVASLAGGWSALAAVAPADDVLHVTAGNITAARTIDRRVAPLAGPVKIRRAADGLFYTDVMVDDQAISMIVDTGASRTMVSSATLAAVGRRCCTGTAVGEVRSLTGRMFFHAAPVQRLTVGSVTLTGAQIGVFDSDRNIAILGQDILAQLGPITLDGDWLQLP